MRQSIRRSFRLVAVALTAAAFLVSTSAARGPRLAVARPAPGRSCVQASAAGRVLVKGLLEVKRLLQSHRPSEAGRRLEELSRWLSSSGIPDAGYVRTQMTLVLRLIGAWRLDEAARRLDELLARLTCSGDDADPAFLSFMLARLREAAALLREGRLAECALSLDRLHGLLAVRTGTYARSARNGLARAVYLLRRGNVNGARTALNTVIVLTSRALAAAGGVPLDSWEVEGALRARWAAVLAVVLSDLEHGYLPAARGRLSSLKDEIERERRGVPSTHTYISRRIAFVVSMLSLPHPDLFEAMDELERLRDWLRGS